jgi:hypothetical protein
MLPPLLQLPNQIPQFMMVAVMDYKKLAAEYPNITDSALKASYKAVLDKKIADLQAMLATYNANAVAAINALQVS